MLRNKKIITLSLLVFVNISFADNGIATAVAASLTSQVVATGSAVYMKKNGMNPQFITTPYGAYAVPGNTTQATPQPQQPISSETPYEAQNQQQNKVEFLNGNVVQAFPELPPAATAGH